MPTPTNPPPRPAHQGADLLRRYRKFCLVGGAGVLEDKAGLDALDSPDGLALIPDSPRAG